MPAFDWNSYLRAVHAAVLDAVAKEAPKLRARDIHALVLSDATPTSVALNDERPFGDGSSRLDPASFRPLRLSHAKLKELEERLSSEKKIAANRRRTLVDVAKRLAKELPKHIQVTPDFVVYVFHPDAGLGLVKKSVDKKLFVKLFPEHDPLYAERKRLDALPPAERVEALIVALDGPDDGIGWEEALDRMVAMGSQAVPHLTKALAAANEQRWQIARALGRIGPTRARDAIPELRRFVDDESVGNNWCAKALGHLGDNEFLVERARAGVQVALDGICATFIAFADEAARDSGERIPIEYELLGSFLEDADDEQKKAIQTDLQPGRSYRWVVHPLDVEPAVAALSSPHAVLRWHAARILGNVKLKKLEAARVVDALSERIRDRNKLVRRLAMLSLQDHARHLQRSHWQAMAEFASDEDPVTKMVADEAAEHLKKKS